MPTWEEVVAIASKLPGVEEAMWYRTPGLKVAGKGFARLRTEAEGALVLVCDLGEKDALLASGDPAFFTTPHYDGYGSILIDLARVETTQLAELIEESWRIKAPKKLRTASMRRVIDFAFRPVSVSVLSRRWTSFCHKGL